MAELTVSDYEQFAAADPSDEDTIQAALDAVLAAARRYCGWHVSPVQQQEVQLNGPGGWRLFVRTKHVVSLDDVTEDGEELEIGTDVVADPETPGMIVRKTGRWSCEPASISVTFTHGYTEAEAADWRQAVLGMVKLRLTASTRDSGDLKRKRVDDVEYEWFESLVSSDRELAAKFAQFRILPGP